MSANHWDQVWKPLDDSKREFRVFVLDPSGDLLEPPRGRLEIVSRDTPPQYDAISYAWGQAGYVRPVYLDNVRRTVTATLETCIRHLRHPDRERRLWCDAICINQYDMAEKIGQVRIMQYIFADAVSVCVWLDSGSQKMKNVMQIIRQVGSADVELSKVKIHGKPFTAENCHDLAIFISDPWWSRLWVMQEVALAKQVSFHHGQNSVAYEELVQFKKSLKKSKAFMRVQEIRHKPLTSYEYDIDKLNTKLNELKNLRLTFPHLEFDGHLITLTNWHKDRLFEALVVSRTRLVTDPRDRVFGMLGLCTRAFGTPLLHTDYTTHLADVFIDFAFSYLQASGSLQLLNQTSYSQNNIVSLPSWVPDWTSAYDFYTERRRLLASSLFQALGNTVRFSVSKLEGGVLCLDASPVDTISKVGMICEEAYNKFNGGKLSCCLRSWERLCKAELEIGDSQYIAGGQVCDAIWQTMLNGLVYNHDKKKVRQCTPEDKHAYEQVKADPLESTRGVTFLDARDSILQAICKRRLVISRRGYIGLAPADAEVGDEIHLLAGGNVPYVLRRRSGDLAFTFVGECYVHGIMFGELVEKGYPPRMERVRLE